MREVSCEPRSEAKDQLPWVSIVLVAHNAAAQVGPCLDSLRSQDYPRSRREFILVHSDCPDGTREAFEAWRDGPGSAETVSILPNLRRILAAGWNVALEAARGDVIVRLDAHARAEPGFLRRNVNILTARGESIVGGMRPSLAAKQPGTTLLWMAERSIFGAGQAAYRRRTTPGYVDTLAHAAYHRRVFETVGGYDERLGRTEDNEIHGRMKRAGFRFFFDPSIVSRHLARPTFRGIVRQKFLNGYWVALTLPVAPQCFSLRHFVPGVFVLALLAGGVLTAFDVWWPLFAIAGSYGLCAIVAAMIEGIRAGETWGVVLAPLLPFVFLSIHAANGLGILVGLVAMPGKWRRWRGYEIPRPMKPRREGERPGE